MATMEGFNIILCSVHNQMNTNTFNEDIVCFFVHVVVPKGTVLRIVNLDRETHRELNHRIHKGYGLDASEHRRHPWL